MNDNSSSQLPGSSFAGPSTTGAPQATGNGHRNMNGQQRQQNDTHGLAALNGQLRTSEQNIVYATAMSSTIVLHLVPTAHTDIGSSLPTTINVEQPRIMQAASMEAPRRRRVVHSPDQSYTFQAWRCRLTPFAFPDDVREAAALPYPITVFRYRVFQQPYLHEVWIDRPEPDEDDGGQFYGPCMIAATTCKHAACFYWSCLLADQYDHEIVEVSKQDYSPRDLTAPLAP